MAEKVENVNKLAGILYTANIWLDGEDGNYFSQNEYIMEFQKDQ